MLSCGAASGTPEGAELKFFSSFAHGGGGWQQSEAELPVAGGGASLLYIGALVLKCAMLDGAAGVHERRRHSAFAEDVGLLLLCSCSMQPMPGAACSEAKRSCRLRRR